MRTTKKKLQDENRRLQRENTLLMLALVDTVRGKPDAIESANGPAKGERYTWRLYRADSAYGGIVVQTFKFPVQSATITAHYLDDLRLFGGFEYAEHRSALGRLKHARDAAIQRSA